VTASQVAFLILIGAVAAQRLWELRISRTHELAILKAGGREHAPGQMAVMRALHGAWIVSMAVEVMVFNRPLRVEVAVPAFGVFAIGQALRIAAIRALGPRWTVKIMTLPGVPAIGRGIFRWVRHPNYVGVALEIFALPLVHGAWVTSLIFTAANALLLRARIQAEEIALAEDSAYESVLGRRARFVPWIVG